MLKNKVFSLFLCAGLLSQSCLIGGEKYDPCETPKSLFFNLSIGPKDPIGCAIEMLKAISLLSVGIGTIGGSIVGYKVGAEKIAEFFGESVQFEGLSKTAMISPATLAVAGIFGAKGVKDFLSSVFTGDTTGVLEGAAMVGISGLGVLANAFAINQDVTQAFVNANLLSVGMISGITVSVGLLISKIVDTYKQYKVGKITASVTQKKVGELIEQTLPDAIEERINALLDMKIPKTEIQIFSTAQSKIFVLKNIEDFFAFPYRNKELSKIERIEAEQVNPYVYKVCMKIINTLQNEHLQFVELDKNGNEIWQDKDENNRKIDDARDMYLKQCGISVKKLHDMSVSMLDKKLQEVGIVANQVFQDITKHITAVDKRKKSSKELNETAERQEKVAKDTLVVKERAILSILYHLCYKKYDQKAALFVNESLNAAKKESRQRVQEQEMTIGQFPGITTIEKKELSAPTEGLENVSPAYRALYEPAPRKLLSVQEQVEKENASKEAAYTSALRKKQKEESKQWAIVRWIKNKLGFGEEKEISRPKKLKLITEEESAEIQRQKELEIEQKKKEAAEKAEQGGILNRLRAWWAGK